MGFYSQGSYNQRFLQPGALRTRNFYNQVSYSQGSYNQVIQPGILTTRRSYNQGSYNQRFLQPGILTTKGFKTRDS